MQYRLIFFGIVGLFLLMPLSLGYSIDTTGLVGYWTFDDDDTSGSTLISKIGFNGTISGSTTGTTGKINEAYTQGNNDYITLGDNSTFDIGTKDFSMSVWVKPDSSQPTTYSPSSEPQIINNYYGSGYAFAITASTGYPRAFIKCNGVRVNLDGTTDITDDGWHHLVATFDRNDRGVLYVDGSVEANISVSSANCDLNNAYDLEFGRSSGYNFQFYGGELDEIGMWTDRVVTYAEVQELNNNGSGLAYPFTGSSPSDTCSPSANTAHEFNLSDNCVINTPINLFDVSFVDTGNITFNTTVNMTKMQNPATGQTVYVSSNSLLKIGNESVGVSEMSFVTFTDRHLILNETAGSFDSARLLSPDVFTCNSTDYGLVYGGSDQTSSSAHMKVGLAFSDSLGGNWTKTGSSLWDGYDPHVLRYNSSRLNMYYTWSDDIYYTYTDDINCRNWTTPVITYSGGQDWDENTAHVSSVGWINGTAYMYIYASELGIGETAGILSDSTGTDNWTASSNNPLFYLDQDANFDGRGAEVIALIKDPYTSEYLLFPDDYYYGFYDGHKVVAGSPIEWKIGIMRTNNMLSNETLGGYERHEDIFMTFNTSHSWEDYGVAGPMVVNDSDTLYFFYEALDGTTNRLALTTFAKTDIYTLN